jgi:pyruvate/2-oxoglutarate dehydrogenase complex dihydrolipoamide acyltransferase (E2) component
VPRTAAQWVDSVIVVVRGERIREVTITHPDGEVVRLSKTGPELANFDVADVPAGRELSYPGVANVVGNALRELNLEDVEPAAAAAEQATIVEYRTFDGLLVRVTGLERNDESWITLEASVDAAQAAAAPPAAPADAAAAAAPPAPAAADPTAEAARINAKVSGWRYKIAGFQYDQMTRRMADLLKAPATP